MPVTLPPQGTQLGRYEVIQNQDIPELNLTAIVLRHQPTGARLLHLACDDPNNVFAVGFRTPPPDSTGIAHILEHTILCGSERYPVRDPFFSMLKRSLNTYMNAMTAADWTFYPVASMNAKDLDNLMEIYLDAVFFPLLREEDFAQEGHRLELSDPEDLHSPLEIKGVVFNEMKGAMADPSSLLGRRLNRELFPTTCYGQNSGGEPTVIPDLTWQQLRDFQKSYYHPSNSWIFTYGNFPLEKHLDRIETLALNRFEAQPIESEIPLEKRLSAPKYAEDTFPLGAEDDPAGRSMVQLAWLTCPIEDTFERAATGLLANLLLGNPAAPLYQALIESGLGQNLSPGTGYHDDYRDTYLAAGLQGTDPGQTDVIEALIISTLERVAAEGFPQERVAAALHQYEFSNREVTGDQYPYGLSLLMRLLGPWLHADDPIGSLCIDQTLARLRQATADDSFFPNLIRKHLLDNPHRIRLLLRPDKDHSQREAETLQKRLDTLDSQLDDTARKKLAEDAAALQRSQEAPDDTDCLPTLELEDIRAAEEKVAFQKDETSGPEIYRFEQPTNGITFLALQFDLSNLSPDCHADIPLFCTLLPQIGAAGQDYLTMARRITAATGGIRLGTNLLESPDSLDSCRPAIDLRAKALDRNQEQMTGILRDMLTAPDFNDLDRLRTVIGQVKMALENSIPGAGHSFAARAAAASLTPAAQLREEWAGLSQVRHIQNTSQYDDQELTALTNRLRAISRQILVSNRVTVAVTAEPAAQQTITTPLSDLLNSLPTGESPAPQPGASFLPETSTLGWRYNLPVAYVAQVFRTVHYTDPDAATLQVLAKLLRANFLHREIREKGGAYGGMAGYNADGGLLSLLSYRDPHLVRTLKVYQQAVDWACEGALSEEMIKEAILAVFGDLDRPLSPGGRGYHEFILCQQGLPPELRQQHRERLLATDREGLIRVARKHLQTQQEASTVAILAGDEMFKNAEDYLQKRAIVMQKL